MCASHLKQLSVSAQGKGQRLTALENVAVYQQHLQQALTLQYVECICGFMGKEWVGGEQSE